MLDLLQKALAFAFVLGVLIAFHEFGHFWVARRLGVKVLRYSVGFGKPLLRYQSNADSPEYVLAALPLGGYVKMLDEREGPVPPEDEHLAFNRQSVWKRIAIVAAGPIFNLVLAVLLFTWVFMLGIPSLQAVIAQPDTDSIAAQAGLQAGDIVVAVNKEKVPSWSSFSMAIVSEAVGRESLDIYYQRSGSEYMTTLALGEESILKNEGDVLGGMGFSIWKPHVHPPAILGDVIVNMPAGKAGLKKGDQILRFDGRDVEDWGGLVDKIQSRPNQRVSLLVKSHNGIETTVSVSLISVKNKMGKDVGYLGASPLKDAYESYRTKVQYVFFDALIQGVKETWNRSILAVKVIGQLITGQASVKNISGPLSIAQYAGESAEIGWVYLLNFMAAISVSLGVLNLLPVPVLDGGHLLFYGIELLKGSPVSDKTMLGAQQIGMLALLLLMGLAFYNDITRIFG